MAQFAGAQVNPLEYPYNPDFDNNGDIGSADLLAFLAIYSTSFEPLGLNLNEDSTLATVDLGQMKYMDCIKACNDLPGHWRMTTFEDVAFAGTDAFSIPTGGELGIWIRDDDALKGAPPQVKWT